MSDNPYAPPPPPNPYGAPPPNPYANPYANPHASSPYPPGPGAGNFNPYAPPSTEAQYGHGFGADVHEDAILADRGTRLGARIVDNVLYVAAGVLGFLPGLLIGEELAMAGGAVVAMLVLAVYQWILIATTGQSLAKKWLGIRIVRLDGSELGFLYGVVLRSWVIEFIGALFSPVALVDALLIFGDERRCLHDHLAGTKVVVANFEG